MELGERVRAARRHKGLTQKELAARVRMTQQNLSDLEKGLIKTSSKVAEIAIECGVSSRWLVREEGPMLAPELVPAYGVREVDEENPGAEDVLIDEVEVRLSAGPGAVVPQYVPTKRRLAFNRDWLIRKRLSASALKVMPVHGESMLPTLGDGDTVLINTADKRVVDGRIYAFVMGRDYSKIKRLRWRSDGALIIVSDNPDKATYPDEVIGPDTAESVYIIGRAVQRAGDL